MKSVLFVLALIPSLAFGASVRGPKFVKTLDGGVAYCNQISQVGNPAYMPTALELDADARGDLRFSAPISFLSCAQIGEESFGWAPRNPLDPVPAKDLSGNAILNVTKGNEFVLLSNTVRIVGLQPISASPTQNASFVIPLDQALSPAERQGLDRGDVISTRFTFFTRAIVSVFDASGKELLIGMRSGGSYSVLFSLVKGADGLVVTRLAIAP